MSRSPSNGSTPTAMFLGPQRPGEPAGLTRYCSAPGSLLASIADSVAAGAGSEAFTRSYFSGDSLSLTSESSCKPNAAATGSRGLDLHRSGGDGSGNTAYSPGPRGPYGVGEISAGGPTAGVSRRDGGGGCGNPLARQSSSPAGFLSHLTADSVARDIGSYSRPGSNAAHATAGRRLQSQLIFSRQSTLSRISEGIPDMGDSIGGSNNSNEVAGNSAQSYRSGSFSVGSWDDNNSITFSTHTSKRAKDNNGDIITSLCNLESQFSLPTTSLEMATVEKFLQIQHDHVPFKVRAKRGCATHPRSIAERERRTRISEKLRKLQDLVPNMDKQTNTADMLDLAVHHIKSLQNQVQILTQERENCTCTSKKEELNR